MRYTSKGRGLIASPRKIDLCLTQRGIDPATLAGMNARPLQPTDRTAAMSNDNARSALILRRANVSSKGGTWQQEDYDCPEVL